MKRRKFLVGGTAALTGAGLLAGARGTSNVESQREVRIAVEGDDNAYLELDPPEDDVEVGCEPETVEIPVRNQTKEDITEIEFKPDLSSNGVVASVERTPSGLTIGESDRIEVEFTCNGPEESNFGFELDVEGASGQTLIEASRSDLITVECKKNIAWMQAQVPGLGPEGADQQGRYRALNTNDDFDRNRSLVVETDSSSKTVGTVTIDAEKTGSVDENASENTSEEVDLTVSFDVADGYQLVESYVFVNEDADELEATEGRSSEATESSRSGEIHVSLGDTSEVYFAARADVICTREG